MPTLQQRQLIVFARGAAGFADNFDRADGALGNGWSGSTWTISGNKAINTPSLGSELATNGDMAADANWTKGTGWTIASGVAHHASGSASNLSEAIHPINNFYRLVWTLANRTAGQFSGIIGSGNSPANYTANGTYTENRLATAGTNAGINGSSTAVGDVDNISTKQLTLNTLFATQDFGKADVDISVKATIVNNNNCGLVLNLDSVSSPANFVIAVHDGTNARLLKCVAGTFTSLISAAATYSAGAPLRVTKSGTTYTLYYNGVAISTPQTVSDAGIINRTIHGMIQTYELNGLDDFAILPN